MIFLSLDMQSIWSAIALVVAIVGCFAALVAWAAIAQERKSIRRVQTALTPDEAWEGAFVPDEVALSNWFRIRGIDVNSCIADFIRACWSAQLGGRATSLTELHSLVARRERARGSAIISAGIAGLLLVVGIVGTLSSVHPILTTFELKVSDSGELVEVTESTEKVNSLVNDMGRAFGPSLIALIGTLVVVFCRGCYAYQLHKFTLQLDRFAISTLIPKFRPLSISGEYAEVKRILSELSIGITKREEEFGEVVTDLQSFVTGITPVIGLLKATAEQSDKASKKLSARSESIADSITRGLGPNSPMFKAVSGFEGIFDRTTRAIDSLTSEAGSMREKNRQDRENLLGVVQELSTKVDAIGSDHSEQKEKVDGLLGDLRTGISNAPKTMANSAKEAVSQGIQLVQDSVDKFRKENKEEGEKVIGDIRKQTSTKMDEISEVAFAKLDSIASAGAEIPKVTEELRNLLTTKSDVETAAVAAIKKQQVDSESALEKPIGDLKKSASELEVSIRDLRDMQKTSWRDWLPGRSRHGDM